MDAVALSQKEARAQIESLWTDVDNLVRGMTRGHAGSDTLNKAIRNFAVLDTKFLHTFESINTTQEHLESIQTSLETITTDMEQAVNDK
ncbi:hypothetical protein PTSG_05543 [Salpingoeca rosetta]|uniref:BLOC-1-related complex subunit 7 n=1 Tax=Salpingoeca rosetta (strain ATCC 50818 / BSB-021) TaxID=946362 RepID=F2UBI2_SALR5|nr:uncharacterized protein PTSG_05543 [Salpingoeca rosetta]EGD73848.1 hypothetical protein PTSG_05543 [Salpingoeca rosetta]|eukprot:XP_004993411.1 hypothetical protein PTSG_05543 [Salpingoeca rosetta]